MRKKFQRYLVIILVLQLVFPWPIWAAGVGKFVAVVGDVALVHGKVKALAVPGMEIQPKDCVVTGKKALTRIELADGSALTLAQNSRLELKDFLLEGSVRQGVFALSSGKLQSKVVKFLGKGSKFEVQTPTAVAGVRGTEWVSLVEVVGNTSQSSFYTLEQAITVYNVQMPAQVVTVGAGQFTVVASGAAPTVPAAFSPAVISGVTGDLAGTTGTTAGSTASTSAGTTTSVSTATTATTALV